MICLFNKVNTYTSQILEIISPQRLAEVSSIHFTGGTYAVNDSTSNKLSETKLVGDVYQVLSIVRKYMHGRPIACPFYLSINLGALPFLIQKQMI